MKSFNFKILKNKFIIMAIIGVVLIISLAIFWLGVKATGLAIGCILTGVGLIYGLKLLQAWRAGGLLLNALNRQATDEHALEVTALQEKMKEAIEKLKASGVHTGHLVLLRFMLCPGT